MMQLTRGQGEVSDPQEELPTCQAGARTPTALLHWTRALARARWTHMRWQAALRMLLRLFEHRRAQKPRCGGALECAEEATRDRRVPVGRDLREHRLVPTRQLVPRRWLSALKEMHGVHGAQAQDGQGRAPSRARPAIVQSQDLLLGQFPSILLARQIQIGTIQMACHWRSFKWA